jgi:hypothetical protein
MVAKIFAGVFGVLVLGVGAFVYHHNTGSCPFSCGTTEAQVTTPESCCSTEETPSCCQSTSRASLVSTGHSCCADAPVCTVKDGQEILAIQPREVK